MRKRLLFYAAILVVLLLMFQLMAFAFYWYYTVWWADMAMHTAGGVFLAFLFAILRPKRILETRPWHAWLSIMLFVFIVGIGWEFFEYAVQFALKPIPFANIPDSISDVICDVSGGIIGACFVLLQKRRYNTTYEAKQNA